MDRDRDRDRDYRLHALNYNRLLEREPREPERHQHDINQLKFKKMVNCSIKWCGMSSLTSSLKKNGITFHRVEQSSMTTATYGSAGAAGGAPPAPAPAPPPPSFVHPQAAAAGGPGLHHLDQRRRNYSHFSSTRAYDDGSEDSRSTRTLPEYKKQTHSEIEKRRRDKMNTYITELSAMVPSCEAVTKKLDKITVLRMTVKYLRNIRGASISHPPVSKPPTFLSESELNATILQAAHDCFLIVVGCDRGTLLYVSASVRKILHYDQSELLGQSMFDLLHPKDMVVFKEQLSSSELNPRDKINDAKMKGDVLVGGGGGGGGGGGCGVGGSRFCSGARRSFFCRIKCKATPAHTSHVVKEDPDLRNEHSHEKKYCVVHCTGYLKSWSPGEMSELGSGGEGVGGEDPDACDLSCLVAVGRALPDLTAAPPPPARAASTRPPATSLLQYMSRHAIDGKFLFVDPRVTLAVGYLPQELLGTSLYEYVTGSEQGAVARTHKEALLRRATLLTPLYSFKRKDGTLALLQTHFKPFKNPWTKDVECVVANNTVVSECRGLSYMSANTSANTSASASTSTSTSGDDFFKSAVSEEERDADARADGGRAEMQQPIESLVPPQNIGSAIAEEVLRRSSRPAEFSPSLPVPSDMWEGAVFNEQAPLVDMSGLQARNDVCMSSTSADTSPLASGRGEGEGASPLDLDGDDEAAMSVIMSLLEADAGLGGPVGFSGRPWTLP